MGQRSLTKSCHHHNESTSNFGQPGLRWSDMSSAVSFMPVKYLCSMTLVVVRSRRIILTLPCWCCYGSWRKIISICQYCPQHVHLIPRSVTGAGPRSRSSFNLHIFRLTLVVALSIFETLITTNTLGKFCWQSWGWRCWRGCRGWGWPGGATPSGRPRSSWGSAPSPGPPQMVLLSINIQIKSSTSALWRRSL